MDLIDKTSLFFLIIGAVLMNVICANIIIKGFVITKRWVKIALYFPVIGMIMIPVIFSLIIIIVNIAITITLFKKGMDLIFF